ncbi:hypothetical protein GGX14DRAFT_322517, partial [Mycena pura]
LGSDHLPITYELDLKPLKLTSSRYNSELMKVDKFLSILRLELGRPLPEIETQEALSEAMDLLCEVLILAVGPSTAMRRLCSHSRRWWKAELKVL